MSCLQQAEEYNFFTSYSRNPERTNNCIPVIQITLHVITSLRRSMAKSVPPSFLPSSPLHLVLLLPFLRSVLHSRASFSKLYYMEYPTAGSLFNNFFAVKELTGRFILMGQHGLLFWTEGYPIKLKSALPLYSSCNFLPSPSFHMSTANFYEKGPKKRGRRRAARALTRQPALCQYWMSHDTKVLNLTHHSAHNMINDTVFSFNY